jgi:polyphosphate kinase
MYCHVGTGNYHATTARLYTDLGLLTADPQVCLDVTRLFHSITGYATAQTYEELLVAPYALRAALTDLIEAEIERQQRRGDGRIIMKLNAIDDVGMIRTLYRAAQAGVSIDLVVRGHTRLRPGVPGYSDNIRVISILGRFLEHDRIYYFANGGDPVVLVGSADLRRRNLEDRIEAMVRVRDPQLRDRLVETLDWALADNVLAWDLRPDGTYSRRRPLNGEAPRLYQSRLMERASQDRSARAS